MHSSSLVPRADLRYESSIIDRALLDPAGVLVHERVEIFNIETCARFN